MSEPAAPLDPVLERRARIASLVQLGKRIGYGLFALAIAAFVAGFFVGFGGLVGTTVTASIVVGSIVLAPAIVFGYGVKAAEREDRQRGR
jgi:Kef-type K+ transport system membrane component KefB